MAVYSICFLGIVSLLVLSSVYYQVLSVNDLVCYDMTRYTQYGFGLSHSVIWKTATLCLVDCARLCIRLANCRSITFDSDSKLCELNAKLVSQTGNRTGHHLAYSEYTSWPSEVSKCLMVFQMV